MESNGSIQRGSSSSIDALDLQVSPKQLDEARFSAKFSNSSRTVSKAEPDVSLKTEQKSAEVDSEAQTDSISKRDVRDVSDNKPGRLRQAAGYIAGGVKKGASAAYDYGAGKLKSGKELASSAWKGGKEFAHHPVDTTLAAMHGLHKSGQAKLASTKQSAAALKEAVAEGGRAFKADPKQATKNAVKSAVVGVGKSLKKRAVSLRTKVAKLIPARVKNHAAPKIKSLFSRSVRETPPQLSASVKAAQTEATQKTEKFTQLKTDGADTLHQAQTSGENFELLGKLLDDPGVFYDSAVDAELTFPGGQTVIIKGEGLERDQRIDRAMSLADKQKSQIREGISDSRQFVDEVKAGNKDLKKDLKNELSALREEAASTEQSDYKGQIGALRKERETLKEQGEKLSSQLKSELSELKKELKSQRNKLKGEIKSASSERKQLKKELEKEIQKGKEVRASIRQEMDAAHKTIDRCQGQLDSSKSKVDPELLSTKRESERDKNLRLGRLMTHKQQKAGQAVEDLQRRIKDLGAKITTGKESLEKLDIDSLKTEKVVDLEKQLANTKKEIKANAREIDLRKRQHSADKDALKKIK
ncbi:hypothetical protein M3P05_03145 [Sansalvadorimonas sp. 2012CJ34-2]|uniref:Uncharacterized protein n=1 Tax=Parendozoicomonas callyspongiae TaxID=2942213 RepID=A0ABT0PC39_9GAMM|nr:hypothetical protein [Sansalvadorimonas sp. 2012CJ34-2]MCL6268947.1 hypothetical protein [Sansalvadorimonas sp. 2012CJ34-2]